MHYHLAHDYGDRVELHYCDEPTCTDLDTRHELFHVTELAARDAEQQRIGRDYAYLNPRMF